ncbi:MAG: YqgE/AlgH family protein [Bacteroidia bacterium]|nr:YqgE/AlgH family protein [Bacteroidia bacterium]
MITSAYRPAKGRFLISEPFMADENFQRTVVLLVEHGKEGSLGFILNRRLKLRIGELIDDMEALDVPVFSGGPVEGHTLYYVHRLGHLPGSQQVHDGLYWGGDFDTLKHMAQGGQVHPDEIRFFVGYSGWAPGQLQSELKRKSWIVAPENTGFVFADDVQGIWQQMLRSLGDKYRIIANYPADPRLN